MTAVLSRSYKERVFSIADWAIAKAVLVVLAPCHGFSSSRASNPQCPHRHGPTVHAAISRYVDLLFTAMPTLLLYRQEAIVSLAHPRHGPVCREVAGNRLSNPDHQRQRYGAAGMSSAESGRYGFSALIARGVAIRWPHQDFSHRHR